jgi:hypothetical protein
LIDRFLEKPLSLLRQRVNRVECRYNILGDQFFSIVKQNPSMQGNDPCGASDAFPLFGQERLWDAVVIQRD